MLKAAHLIQRVWWLWLAVLAAGMPFSPYPARAEQKELYLFCGAGLRQPVDALLADFQKETGWKVKVEFGGSGQLLARIEATGKGDLYLPGSHFYIEHLEKKGRIRSALPIVLHTPVVAVNKKKVHAIKTFSDLTQPGIRVGLGDPKAMALGRTGEQVLKNSGLKEAIEKNVVVRATTVKQLTLYAAAGDVDAAIIARADAFQNLESLSFFPIDPQWYSPEVIKVAVLKSSEKPKAAHKLADYLSSERAQEVFGHYGFLPVH